MSKFKAYFTLNVAGEDRSSVFQPLVISIDIHLSAGHTADTASVKLDDAGGQNLLPNIGDPMTVGLGWDDEDATACFDGTVDDVEFEMSRGSGRILTISAKSADVVKGKLKHIRHAHKDDSTLGDAAQAWGGDAGVSVQVHSDLASIKRPYWGMHGESFFGWGRRIAEAYGATFKVYGSQAVLAPRGSGTSADGGDLAGLTAAAGDNLISCNIKPLLGRPTHKAFHTKFFDFAQADWMSKDEDASNNDTGAEAEHTSRHTEVDEDASTNRSKSNSTEADRNRGTGTAVINGDATAEPEASISISGARDGVDGSYVIDSVDHSYSRGGGWTTSISVKQPSGGAGSTLRSATTSDSSGSAYPNATSPGFSPGAASGADAPAAGSGSGLLGHN